MGRDTTAESESVRLITVCRRIPDLAGLVRGQPAADPAHLLLRDGPLTQVLRRPLPPGLGDLVAPLTGGRGGAPAAHRRGHTIREPARGGEEAGGPAHAVVRGGGGPPPGAPAG